MRLASWLLGLFDQVQVLFLWRLMGRGKGGAIRDDKVSLGTDQSKVNQRRPALSNDRTWNFAETLCIP